MASTLPVGTDNVLTITRAAATYYYHYDGLGSVTELTDSTGALAQAYEYDAGNARLGQGDALLGTKAEPSSCKPPRRRHPHHLRPLVEHRQPLPLHRPPLGHADKPLLLPRPPLQPRYRSLPPS